MNGYDITLRSITPAQRAQGLLQKNGIPVRLQRTPRWMEAQGCGYRLHLESPQLASAVEILNRHQIPYRKIYQYQADGSAREVSP